MPRPRIAIATCADYADLKVDDELLREALAARGAEATALVWDGAVADWSGFDAPAATVAWNSNKAYLHELAEGGVRIVPTVWIEHGEQADLNDVLAAQGWEEAVVKPAVDLGASHAVQNRPTPGDFRVKSIWGRIGRTSRAQPRARGPGRARPLPGHPTPLYARVDLVSGLDDHPCLIELELIEPNLYLSTHPPAVDALVDAVLLRIDVDADRDVLE